MFTMCWMSGVDSPRYLTHLYCCLYCRLYVYTDGLARFATEQYSQDKADLK